MKRKILTVMLCCTMAFSLAACGGKQEEPVNTEVNEQSEEKDEAEEAQETVKEEESVSEPEQVELTADTIDKYFGFEYADVADDAITGFSFTNDADYGNSTIEINSLPAAYADTTAPDFTQITYLDSLNIHDAAALVPYKNFVEGWEMPFEYGGNYTILKDEIAIYGAIEPGRNPIDSTDGARSLELLNYLKEGDFPHFVRNNYNYYAILLPGEVLDTIPAKGADLLIYNDSDDYVSVMDGTFVGLSMYFNKMDLAVAGDITAESTIEDVVAKYAPSAGTITDNGAIVLTWNTASGTVAQITFAADTHKAVSVKMISADMPADIFETLS